MTNVILAFLLACSYVLPLQNSQAETKLPSTQSTVRPFNNMAQKLILLAEEVLADNKTTPLPANSNIPAQSTPVQNTPAQTTPPPLPSVAAPTPPDSKTTKEPEVTAPVIEEKTPDAVELKLPLTSVTAPKEQGMIQKMFNSQDQTSHDPGGFRFRKKKPKIEAEEETTPPSEIVKKSVEPYPIAKPDTNYRTQRLPNSISKKSYNRDNEHLPLAAYSNEYKQILFDSAASGNLDVLRAMIDNFDDTEILDEEGNTALIYAVMAGNLESALTLTSLGANVNAQNYNGVSALYAATKMGRIDLVKLMLARQADPNLADKNDTTPLMLACALDFSNIAYMLIKKGANPDKRMKDGNSAMHLAASKNNAASLNVLITNGADIEIRNFKSGTPLMMAAALGQDKSVAILINAGADISKKNAKGQDIIELASKSGNKSVSETIESEQIRQKITAQKLLATRATRYVPKDDSIILPSSTIVKRVGSIPLPFKRPERPTVKQITKPSFSQEEMEKMQQ